MTSLELFDQESLDTPTLVGALPWADRVRITARDLITERVLMEFDGANAVEPRMNLGFDRDGGREQIVARALEAFERGRFLLLADNRQIEALDEFIAFTPGAKVVFLRLTPLRGG